MVVILAGTNDLAGNTGLMTLEEIEGNLASMSDLAHANGIRVVIASVLPVYDGGQTRDGRSLVMTDRRRPEQILALNEWIKNYAAHHGDTYLDYFSALVDEHGFLKKELSHDGLHPTRRAMKCWLLSPKRRSRKHPRRRSKFLHQFVVAGMQECRNHVA